MAINNGTIIHDTLRTPDSLDTFPIIQSVDIQGGFKSVSSIGERDAIPFERRQEGMLVNVQEPNGSSDLWVLIDNSDPNSPVWDTLSIGGDNSFGSVRVSTVTQITAISYDGMNISMNQDDGTIFDGIVVAQGDRVLIKDGDSGSYDSQVNGIYEITKNDATGLNAIRTLDSDEDDELYLGKTVIVREGTLNFGQTYVLTEYDPTDVEFGDKEFTLLSDDIAAVIGVLRYPFIWNASTTYNEGDYVKYVDVASGINRIYVALRSSTGSTPSTSLADWQDMSNDGISARARREAILYSLVLG